jgi:hypothetical protein
VPGFARYRPHLKVFGASPRPAKRASPSSARLQERSPPVPSHAPRYYSLLLLSVCCSGSSNLPFSRHVSDLSLVAYCPCPRDVCRLLFSGSEPMGSGPMKKEKNCSRQWKSAHWQFGPRCGSWVVTDLLPADHHHRAPIPQIPPTPPHYSTPSEP